MTEIPALDLVADRKVVKTARWNFLRSPRCGVGGLLLKPKVTVAVVRERQGTTAAQSAQEVQS